MNRIKVEDIIERLIVIPDTNILLYLYKCSFNASQNIIDLLEKMKESFIVPYHVYTEYIRHKGSEQNKIDKKYESFTRELNQSIDKLSRSIKNNISEKSKYYFPNCDLLQTNIDELINNMKSVIDSYDNSLSSERQNKTLQIQNVERIVRYWVDNGHLRDEYSIPKILEYIKEGELRYKYKMPPGYMDEGKDVQKNEVENFENLIRKYGDLFIWKEIIEVGNHSDLNTTIVFLTNDNKEDWWELKGEQNNKEPVEMRKELFNEFQCKTGNPNIRFMTLQEFYNVFSDYYTICDRKTKLELNYESYVSEQLQSIRDQIEELVNDYLTNSIDLENISPAFLDVKKPDIEFYEIYPGEISLHYSDDDESVIYKFTVIVTTLPIHIINNDDTWLADIELKINVACQIYRDLHDLSENSFSHGPISHDIISIKDSWEVIQENESDCIGDQSDTLEDFYNH